MPDLEKVIGDLEGLTWDDWHEWHSDSEVRQIAKDAIELLKEQETVEPVLVGRMWECGRCYAPVGIFMDDRRDQFCRTCGTKVKWDD